MANPADLTASAVEIPPADLYEAEILDSAVSRTDEVRCVIAELSTELATDPLPWTPVMTVVGEFWPKRGDRAKVTGHADGPPVIAWWAPAGGAPPDVAGAEDELSIDGIGMVIHGEDGSTPRPTDFAHYVWVGLAEPENATEFDQWIKPE